VSRVLVTGGGGFLGSHLVERLERDGHDVVVARSADYDLTSMDDAARMFDDAKAELVFHLAAEVGGIGANRANPGRYWYANLMMGTHVLEQARAHGTPKLVLAGTICAYPKLAQVPFREDDLWNGYPEETNAPYGVAKKALLVGAQAYREQYGLNTIYLLPVNLYGPRDNFHETNAHVIPDLIRKMVEAADDGRDEIVLWGDGSPTREFLYVDDCVHGLVLAAERYDGPEPVNLGTGEEISIAALAALVAELTGFAGAVRWDTSKPNGQPRRRLDTSRAEELFGFRARIALREGLERTVAWYRSARTPAGVGLDG
jgi:GDP-L-fucose synthase